MCNGLISRYRQMYLEWGGAHNRLEHLGNLYGNCESVGKSTGRKETTKQQKIGTKWRSRCVRLQCGACRMFSIPLIPDNKSTIFLQNDMNHSLSHIPEDVKHSNKAVRTSNLGVPCCIYLTVSFSGQSEK